MRCPSGHLFTSANTTWYSHPNGRKYKRCRACHKIRSRLRYRNDDAHREARRQQARDYYWSRRGLSACEKIPAQPQHDRDATLQS